MAPGNSRAINTPKDSARPGVTTALEDRIFLASLRPTSSGSDMNRVGIPKGAEDLVRLNGGCIRFTTIPLGFNSKAKVRVRASIAPLVEA